jgi:hypothetical protein
MLLLMRQPPQQTPPQNTTANKNNSSAGSTPRAVRVALEHEEPQRPSELRAQEGAGGGGGGGTSVAGPFRAQVDAEHVARGQGPKAAARYDRDHVKAGDQGRGAEAVHSKASIGAHNRGLTNKGVHD